MKRLFDKVAVVTGGAQGLGLAIARRFQEEGASVVIADVDRDRAAAAAAEAGVDHVPCDVRRRASVQALVDGVADRFGRLDVFVANAGVAGGGDLLELRDDDWERVLAVNLTGVFLCNQIAARQLVAQANGGAIVNLASIMAVAPRAETVAYGATKAAVVNLTQSSALALAPHGIRVNAIGPGYTETDMTAAIRARPAAARAITDVIPLGGFGTPADVADAALFLASDDAAYITGQVLYVDGGWLLHPRYPAPTGATS